MSNIVKLKLPEGWKQCEACGGVFKANDPRLYTRRPSLIKGKGGQSVPHRICTDCLEEVRRWYNDTSSL